MPESAQSQSSMEVDNLAVQAIAQMVQNQMRMNTSLEQLMAQLTNTQKAHEVQAATHANTIKSVISKPEPFKSGTADARRYLQYFTLWARAQGPPLNSAIGTDGKQWIAAFLSNLQGEAAQWAVPLLAQIEAYHRSTVQKDSDYPAEGNWSTFVENFKLRFQATDDRIEAQRELNKVSQGSKGVAEYAARFQEIAARTGYSAADLMARFKQGLSEKSRYHLALATLAKEPTTLEELIKVVVHNEAHLRNYTDNPRSAPTRDPYAMDIDATRPAVGNGRTYEDFKAAMRRRCFGCGSATHEKASCTSRNARCNYCSRTGHLETVCQDKFLGRAKGGGNRQKTQPRQRVAATDTAPFTLFPEEPTSSHTAAPAVIDFSALQAQIAAQAARTNQLLSYFPAPPTAPQDF